MCRLCLGSVARWGRVFIFSCAAVLAPIASSPSCLGQIFTWGDNFDGNWSDQVRWVPVAPPGGPNGVGVDVILADIFGLGFPNNDDVNFLGPPFGPAYWDTISREVTLDTAGVSVDSVLIEEYPWPVPPFFPAFAPGHRNVLKLDHDLTVTNPFGITLRGTRAVLNTNGRTVTGNVTLEAPPFDPILGHFWHRNRIGLNVSLDDGLNGDLPGSAGGNFPFLTVIPPSLLYHKALYHQTPLVFHTNTPALDVTEPVSNAGTVGIIQGNLDSQGLVWFNQNSRVAGTTINHSRFGYFRYDGSLGNEMRFQQGVTNSDQHAGMDINGRGYFETSVLNTQLATMYTRARTDVETTWTNSAGAEFLFQPVHNHGNPYTYEMAFRADAFNLNRNGLNSGFQFASAVNTPLAAPLPPQLAAPNFGAPPAPVPGVDVQYPYLSLAEFDGDIVHGKDQPTIEWRNQQGAVLNFRGDVRLGLVNRHPPGMEPDPVVDYGLDRIATLVNETGAEFSYVPRTPASQLMDITGEIINDGTFALPVIPLVGGAPTSVSLFSQINLMGNVRVRGRFLPTPPTTDVLVTNTNGAVLNYNAFIDVGYDQLANGSVIDVPHGNLDNTGGTINGFGSGNMVFRGGNQVNNGTITLADFAQFRTGRQGGNLFTNNGLLAGVVYTGPRPQDRSDYATYTPALAGSPTLHASAIINSAGAVIRVDPTVTLNLNSSAVNNFGQVHLAGGTLNPAMTAMPAVGGVINNAGARTTFDGGMLVGPRLINEAGGLIDGFGGILSTTTFANHIGGLMSLGNGLPNSLQINSTTVTQAGSVTMAPAFNLVTNATGLVNSGTITMTGLSGNLASPGNLIVNLGTISGSGLIGFANSFTGFVPTVQFLNVGAASLNVGPLGMSIGGAAMPLNFGTINVGAGSGLAIVASTPGSVFSNSGNINLAGALDDGLTGRGFSNAGRVAGTGAIDFASGIANTSLGLLSASGPAGLLLNAAYPGATVGNTGLMAIQPGSRIDIPGTPFTNNGDVNMFGAASLTNLSNATLFTNGITGNVNVSGAGNAIDFNAAAASSIINNGRMNVINGGLTLNPVSNLGVINNGFITLDPSTLDIGNLVAGGATLTNNGFISGVTSVIRAGTLTNPGFINMFSASGLTVGAGGVNNTGGAIIAELASPVSTTGAWNNTNGLLTVAGGSTLTTGAFTNDGGLLNVVASTTATVGNLTNSPAGGAVASILVDNASTLTTGAVTNPGQVEVARMSAINAGASGYNNTLGVTSLRATSTLTSGAFNNTAGELSLYGGSTATTTGAFTNATAAPDLAIVIVDGASRLSTVGNNFTDTAGDVTVSNGSTLDLTTLLGIVRGAYSSAGGNTAFLSGSTGSIGPLTLTAGADFAITGGSVVNMGVAGILGNNITATGSAIQINGAGSALNSFGGNLTNTSSQISLNAGATLDLTRLLGLVRGTYSSAAGTLDLTGGSSAFLGAISTNSGLIRVDSGSTLVALNTTNLGPGNFDITGASTATVLHFDNLGILRASGAGSTFNAISLGAPHVNGGQMIADVGGALNFGLAGAREPVTNANGGFPGLVSIENAGSTLNAGTFTNPMAGSVLHLTDGGTGTVAALTNSGAVRVADGSTLTADATTNNADGTMDVNDGTGIATTITVASLDNLGTVRTNGAMAKFNVGAGMAATTNVGQIIADVGGVFDNGPAGNRRDFTNGNAAGTLFGQVIATLGGTFNAKDVSNNVGSLTKAAGPGSVLNVGLVTNNGIWNNDPGGVTNSGAVTNTGVAAIDGMGSAWNTRGSNWTNAGQTMISRGGVLDLTFLLGAIRGDYTSAGGNTIVDGTGSTAFVGTTALTVANLNVSAGGSWITAGRDLNATGSQIVVAGGTVDLTTALGAVRGAYTATGGDMVVDGPGSLVRAGTSMLTTSDLTVGTQATWFTGGRDFSAITDSQVLVDRGGTLDLSGLLGIRGNYTLTDSNTGVNGPGSFWNVGTVAQTNGSVSIRGGGRGDTFGYTLTTGGLTLDGPSSVAMSPTLRVRGNFTNTRGAVNEVNMARFVVNGTISNNSSISLQGMSSLLGRTMTNDGVISLETASTFATNEDGNLNPLTNSGLVALSGGSSITTGNFGNSGGFSGLTVASGSTATVNDLDNLGLVRVSGATSLLTTLSPMGDGDTANGGQIVLDIGATWINGGRMGLGTDAITNTNGGFPGMIRVENGSTFSGGVFSNPLADSMLRVSRNSTGTVGDITSSGTIRIDVGSRLTGGDVTKSVTGLLEAVANAGDPATTGNFKLLSNLGAVRSSGAPAALNFIANTMGRTHANGGVIVADAGGTINFGNPNTFWETVDNQNTAAGGGLVSGTFDIRSGSTLNAGWFRNSGSNSLLRVADAGSVANLTELTNSGFVVVDPGGVINVPASINSTGSITIDGANSAIKTFGNAYLPVAGQTTVTRGGLLDLTNATGLTRGTLTATGGDSILIDGAGSRAEIGDLTLTSTNLVLANGGVINMGVPLLLGSAANSTTSTVAVNGTGSALNTFGGNYTNADSQITVSRGGTVDLTRFLGLIRGDYVAMGSNANMTVTGTGSRLIAGSINASAGSIHAMAGALIHAPGGITLGAGTFTTVDGAGSLITSQLVPGGGPGVGNTTMTGMVGNRAVLKINNGGTYITGNLTLPPAPMGGMAGNAVRVDPATLIVSGNANFNPQDIFEVDDTSLFQLGGSFDNAMQVPQNWIVNGRVELNGFGSNLQLYEVSGKDFGNVLNPMFPTFPDLWNAAYGDNFAIGDHVMHQRGTLVVSPLSRVQFVDNRDSLLRTIGGMDDFATQPPGTEIMSTGGLADTEALYVNRLVLGASSQLDLGLLHVYYREVCFDFTGLDCLDDMDFQNGAFTDVLMWQGMGITFVPDAFGVTRYPIPFTFIPEPGSCTFFMGLLLLAGRFRRSKVYGMDQRFHRREDSRP